MLELVFRNYTNERHFKEEFFIKILAKATEELKFKNKIDISLSMVGEARIRKLNNQYRRKNKATDVLSFPLNDQPVAEHGNLSLGDIFICPSFAKKAAKRENVAIESKIAWLTVHGFLHLAGYDHESSKEEADKMFNLEKRILSKINFHQR